MNSPRCNAAQNTCTFSLIMCLKNLATNTLIPTVLRPLQEPADRFMEHLSAKSPDALRGSGRAPSGGL
jgi:hypothetical protein